MGCSLHRLQLQLVSGDVLTIIRVGVHSAADEAGVPHQQRYMPLLTWYVSWMLTRIALCTLACVH